MSKTLKEIGEIALGAGLIVGGAMIGNPLLVEMGVSLVISGAGGLVISALNPQDLSIPGVAQNQQDSASYRRVVYGAVEVGGVLSFDSMPAGTKHFQEEDAQYAQWRHQIYTVAGHQIASFGRNGHMIVVIDGIPTDLVLDSSGYWVPGYDLDPYGGAHSGGSLPQFHIALEFDTGDPASTSAFPLLSAACPQWNAACVQRGCAKVHVAMRWDRNADGSNISNSAMDVSEAIYVNGRVPQFRFPVTGKPIVDTRSPIGGGNYAVAANPSNPALVIYDYLIDAEFGLGADPASIDIPSINAAANVCEERVVVCIAQNGHSVSENRYDCNGIFDQSQARGDVLKAMITSLAGTIVPPGDLWHLFAGAYSSPVLTLTDDDLRDSLKGDFRISRRDIANGVKGTFFPQFLPTNQTQQIPGTWRWTDFPPYQGNGLNGTPNYVAEDGGQVIWKEVRFAFTTSIWMAQRLGKIILQALRFQVTLYAACKLTAFPVQAGDTITFVHKRWAGLTPPAPTTFFVLQSTIVLDNSDGSPVLGVDLVLRETDPVVFAFAAPTAPLPAQQGEYSQYGTLGVI